MACAGRAVRFSLQVSGLPRPQVCWSKDALPLASSDTCKFFHDDEEHTLMLLNVFSEDAGTYSCQAKNEYGEATSSAPLTVEGTCSEPQPAAPPVNHGGSFGLSTVPLRSSSTP